MTEHWLTPLLAPRSIALVGASPKQSTPGNDTIVMLARSGFGGEAFLINPAYHEIAGRKCYGSFADLPQPVDLAILAVGNARLEASLRDAVEAGARAAVIFASCYLENDASPPLTERIAAIARAAGIPICGGNCMGFYNDAACVWAAGFPAARAARPGGITFISHAGSVFGAFAHNDPRFRFNLVVSAGQELATTAADYLDYAMERPETKVAGLFLEAVREPERFVRALEKAAARDVPVVVLKTGRTATSAALALSHSGAIAGNDAAYEALFERYGVIRVDTLDELGATLLLFAQGRRAAIGGLAVIQDSGGERGLVIDLAADLGVPFARIGAETVKRLSDRLEYGLEPVNPLDAWGTGRDFTNIFLDCFTALLEDSDTGLGIFFNDLRDGFYIHEGFAEATRRSASRTRKPVAYATNFSQVRHDGAALALADAGIPVMDGTVPALLAARHMLAYRDFRNRTDDPPPLVKPSRDWRTPLAKGPMDEVETLALLADYGIPVVSASVVDDADAAVRAARAIGYPVACKTAMPGRHHKSDVDGVRLGLSDDAAVRAAYADLSSRLGPRVLIAAMAKPGVELALGLVNDPQFGPIVMVAAGGILIEVLRDARYVLAPFGQATARRMLNGLRLRKLLVGLRGKPPVNIEALARAIARFSVLAAELGGSITELDVNPLIAGPEDVAAVDALVISKKE
ncbi:MAG TPA: acetate--CoA ligase family protein [Alphaproteobacteria bacterium]